MRENQTAGLVCALFFIGAGIGGIVGYHIARSLNGATYHAAVFKEQVEHHNCKPKSLWRNGVEVKDISCVLPDGTILMKE
jgi:hypothetical protein